MIKLGFFASHNGSNMQSIIEACKTGRLIASPALLISNNSSSGAILKAVSENIPNFHLSSFHFPEPDKLDTVILDKLKEYCIDLIILAGYMKKLGPKTLSHYKNRILNIHPALLPKYGGPGFYGTRVHEAVLNAGEKITGITIHLVDEIYDHGKIVNQLEIPIQANDTVESLSACVLQKEHFFFVETLKSILEGKIDLDYL
jgi:phosphoribosylglycinamide formyltransferase-1